MAWPPRLQVLSYGTQIFFPLAPCRRRHLNKCVASNEFVQEKYLTQRLSYTHTWTLHSAPNYVWKVLPPVWIYIYSSNAKALASSTHKLPYADSPSCSYYQGRFILYNINKLVFIFLWGSEFEHLFPYPKTQISLASKVQLDTLASFRPCHWRHRWATCVVARSTSYRQYLPNFPKFRAIATFL